MQGPQAQLRCPGRQENFWAEGGTGRAPGRTSPRRVRGAQGAPELCFLMGGRNRSRAWLGALGWRAEHGSRKEGRDLQDRLGGLLLGQHTGHEPSCAHRMLSSTSGLTQLTPVRTMPDVSDKPPLRTTALHTPLHSAVEDRGQEAHPGAWSACTQDLVQPLLGSGPVMGDDRLSTGRCNEQHRSNGCSSQGRAQNAKLPGSHQADAGPQGPQAPDARRGEWGSEEPGEAGSSAQAERGLAGASSSPQPPEMPQSLEQACFLWMQWEEEVHSIVPNYLLSPSPQESCLSSYCQGPACLPFPERGKALSPPLVGWAEDCSGPWNLSCQLKPEERVPATLP